MNMRKYGAFGFIALALLVVGCTRVVVHKDPDHCDKGIRYYRPKPYLFIAPAGGGDATFSVSQGKPLEIKTVASAPVPLPDVVTTGFSTDSEEVGTGRAESVGDLKLPPLKLESETTPSGPQPPKAISIQLQYLPDFAEEYSIQLKPGLGIGELNIQLQNGWNLTSVGMKTDQQTDEIIKSVADLVGSVGKIAGGAESLRDTTPRPPVESVYATNVPFGFYEAVIATDPCGRKQLYGWRYVGFMPFQCCPTRACGMDQICCNLDCDAIYGLVWVDGIMQFAKIGEIPKNPVLH